MEVQSRLECRQIIILASEWQYIVLLVDLQHSRTFLYLILVYFFSKLRKFLRRRTQALRYLSYTQNEKSFFFTALVWFSLCEVEGETWAHTFKSLCPKLQLYLMSPYFSNIYQENQAINKHTSFLAGYFLVVITIRIKYDRKEIWQLWVRLSRSSYHGTFSP